MEKKQKIKRSPQEVQIRRKLHSAEIKVAEAITSFSGSMTFVYVHVIWFTFWILAGQGVLEPYVPAFDPFPYGLLTMIVSLEAIFLATFIMITQNRLELEEDLEEFEEEREQMEEEREQEELEEEVEDIQKDLDDIKRSINMIQSKIVVEKNKANSSNQNN